jgi:hypothetical protein
LLENTLTDINSHKDFDDSFDQKSLADVRSTGEIDLVTQRWDGHGKIKVLGKKIVWIGYYRPSLICCCLHHEYLNKNKPILSYLNKLTRT